MAKEKILAVEDDKDILQNIVTLLEEEGYSVFPASNGIAGIEAANTFLPDLILCDVLMPGMDGFRVIEELQKNRSTRSIPFLFVTAKTEKEDLRRGMLLGADDYIFKPFEPEELLAAIETRLKKKNSLIADLDEKQNQKTLASSGKLFLKVNGVSKFIKLNEIVYISAERQYSSIKLKNEKSFLLKKSINEWEKILPADSFLRIHRSTLVNSDLITKIEKSKNSYYLVYLQNPEEYFTMSRRYATKVRKSRFDLAAE